MTESNSSSSHFIWYELLTNDPGAAASFYGEVLGWKANDSGQEGMDYQILTIDDIGVGGLMALPPGAAESGMQSGWLGYVSVPDVDESVAEIIAAGGAELMPAMDVPGVGRFALVADPQGASLYVMRPIGDGVSPAFSPSTPGHGGWHELHTNDWERAFGFYRAQFGWGEADAMDMGPMGTYLLFNLGDGDAVGGIFNDPNVTRPYWLYYFNVDDIEAATERVKMNGANVMMDPHQVPSGDWIIQARDPQGTMFALVGPKR
jgi:predicted enzyme related to lactoylglutathione lyase